MNKTLLTITLIGAIALTGCGGFKNNIGKAANALSTGNYTATVWSGGKAVRTYEVKNGFINTEVDSDGYFFFIDGKLVRVSGTVTIEQQ